MLLLYIWHWANCDWLHSQKNSHQQMVMVLLLWQVGLIANVKLHFYEIILLCLDNHWWFIIFYFYLYYPLQFTSYYMIAHQPIPQHRLFKIIHLKYLVRHQMRVPCCEPNLLCWAAPVIIIWCPTSIYMQM